MTLDPAYPQGGGGTAPIDLPDGSIPKVIGGVLVESALVEDGVEVIAGKTIEAPAASFKLGANLVLSNHGEIVQFSNQAYGDETLPVIAFHDDNGSETPVDYKLEPFEINPSQPLDGDSFSGTELKFEANAPLFRGTFLATPFGTLVLELTFRGDGVQTDGMRITMRIGSFLGPIIWQSANEVQFNAGVGYTINAVGDTPIRLEAPFILRDGENLFVTFDVLPTNIISLKGNITTEFVPYLITKIQEVSRVPMASEEYADSAGATAWGDISGTLADQTDLQTELDLKEDKSQKGVVNGYAPLDGSSHVPAANLPSYVDDVLEFANLAAFPVTGETGKIYIAIDTNLTYRWSGTIYVELTDTTAVWGNVSGLLSNQTDLNNALASKANKDGETITNASVNGVTLSAAGSTDYLAEDGTYKTIPSSSVYGTGYESWSNIPEYENSTITPYNMIDEDTAVLSVGTYEITSSYSYRIDSDTSSIFHAFLIDDVITGQELEYEAKDRANYMPASRTFKLVVGSPKSYNLKQRFKSETAGKKAFMADVVVSIIKVE